MDEKIKQLVQALGGAINECISGSEDVNKHIQNIRDEGYDLYVVLDATIGLNKQGEGTWMPDSPENVREETLPATPPREAQFRINVNDLSMLRSLGIDPTRKTKSTRRVEPLRREGGR